MRKARSPPEMIAVRNLDRVEMPSPTTDELMSPSRLHIDPNNQSLPLLEATLVPDVPDEPVYIYVNSNSRQEETVYDAFRISDTLDDDMPDWLRNNYRVLRNTCRLLKKNYRVIVSILVFVGTTAVVARVVTRNNSAKEPETSLPTVSEKPTLAHKYCIHVALQSTRNFSLCFVSLRT